MLDFSAITSKLLRSIVDALVIQQIEILLKKRICVSDKAHSTNLMGSG